MPSDTPKLARYSRQMLFAGVGPAGQQRLRHAQVVIVGCGALGSVQAETLVRAGVGHVRIIDRDFIELDNLQRQVLFDEHDIAEGLPKAEAAGRKLRRINSSVEIDARVADVSHINIETMCGDADLILDGTDNFETRYLINDLSVKHEIPWVYGACIAAEGLVMPILPHETPCLRCIWDQPPAAGETPTCESAGVLGPVVNVVASIQALEAIKILIGAEDAVVRKLVSIDLWTGRIRSLDMQTARDQGDCPCCKHGTFDYLSGELASTTTTLCGRNAVQVRPAEMSGAAAQRVNLNRIAEGLPFDARPKVNVHLLRFAIDGLEFTVFPDGRAIIKGTSDPAVARAALAKYVGT